MFDEDRRESKTRLVKKDVMSATRLSVVVLMLFGVDRGILTSPHASIDISDPPASTISSSAARAFYWNLAGLLQTWILVAGLRVYK
jgi:hypothetical protein